MKTRLFLSLIAIAIIGAAILTSAAPASAQTPSVTFYVVRPGDYVTKIALQFGVSTSQIINANHLVYPYRIYPGQVLMIAKGVTPAGTIYTVQRGDTLYRIGLRFGVYWRLIADANGIYYPYNIYAGQRLRIPGGASQAMLLPEQAIREFYGWYMKLNQGGQDVFTTRAYRSSPYLTAGFIQKLDGIPASARVGGLDPVVCSPQIPSTISVDAPIISGNIGRVIIRDNFHRAFTVALVKEGSYWKISDVTCSVD